MNALVLAGASLRFYWGRSLVLVLALAVILAVPLVTRGLLGAAEGRLLARAEATPLLLGARGSRLDLVMGALYFGEEAPPPVTAAAAEAIWDTGLAAAIPLHTAFEAEGARVVGTTLDYFDLRGLGVAEGRQMATLGEAVLGHAAARRLRLGPGGTLLTAPRSLFDLDGAYPLELSVVGVLARAGTPDDEAVFVDVKTAWVVAGIGHGHEDVLPEGASPEEAARAATAAAAVAEFRRITPENAGSFHFHGDPDAFPVSAVIVAPFDARGAAILQGRFLDAENPLQLVEPAEVMEGLVARLFRIGAVLDAVALVVGAAALLAAGLALFLSLRLREPEMRTAFRLGARRGTIARLVAAETVMILLAAGAIAGLMAAVARARAEAWTGWILGLGA